MKQSLLFLLFLPFSQREDGILIPHLLFPLWPLCQGW